MTAHVIVLSTPAPNKTEGAKKYAESVQPLLKTAGVTPKLRGPVTETLAGQNSPATVLALEFPDRTAAIGFFAQHAYRELIPLRDDSFSQMEIYIMGA
ncbi:DUF1330 domain-containing protein [Roseovarius sp. CAU 1744]|uniref:DUF1330 domain-containing protein n=1 Tax=Roseovarius sp. CAU 1744 TaxID=3140368 RepID=UPI00325A4A06